MIVSRTIALGGKSWRTVSQHEQGISWSEDMMHVHTQEQGWEFPQLRFLVYDTFLQKTLRDRQIEGGKTPPEWWRWRKSFSVSCCWEERVKNQGGGGKWAASSGDSWNSVWSDVGYKLKRALSELEALKPNLYNTKHYTEFIFVSIEMKNRTKHPEVKKGKKQPLKLLFCW